MNENGHTNVNQNYQAYAIADESIVKRFMIVMRNGQTISLSYSLLPALILNDNSELIIKTHEFEIVITGRNLMPLLESFSEESLLYIRESPSGTDDGHSSVFISNIEIAGELLGT
ncbi:hypothetical protein [Marinoscillum sp.]|uniref:hypothetical protein n=1 Tax=Marinoscillum sp. TaxID=2024838 RepID=UPI003BAA3894